MAQGSTPVGRNPVPIVLSGARAGVWLTNVGNAAVWCSGPDGRRMEVGDGVRLDPDGEPRFLPTAGEVWGVCSADRPGEVSWAEL